MSDKKTKHYVNNADFLQALIAYRENCEKAKKENKPEPSIPNYIGECFLKIADHLSRKPNFISYSFRDEMISDGIENCLMYFRNFDPDKSKNPFAYFTQIIYYAFLRRIMKEKKQLYVKYKATEQFGLLDEATNVDDSYQASSFLNAGYVQIDGNWKQIFMTKSNPNNPDTFPFLVIGNKVDL